MFTLQEQGEIPDNIRSGLNKLKPLIHIDNNGVGTLSDVSMSALHMSSWPPVGEVDEKEVAKYEEYLSC